MKIHSTVTLYEITDYSFFKHDIFNRPLSRTNIDKLKQSISDGCLNEYYPVLVFPDGTIFDGQHRVEAMKELGNPVIIRIIHAEDVNVQDLIRVNQNSEKWNVDAYLKVFSLIENEWQDSYIMFGRHLKEYAVSASSLMFIVATHTDMTTLKAGTLNYDSADRLKVTLFMGLLRRFSIYPFYKQHRFIKAAKRLFSNPEYEHDHMVSQLEKYSATISTAQKIISWGVAYRQLVDLYNYRTKHPFNRIEFKQEQIDEWSKS